MARDEEARKEAQVAELQRKLAEAKALTKAAEESKQAGFGSSPHPASGNPTKESDFFTHSSLPKYFYPKYSEIVSFFIRKVFSTKGDTILEKNCSRLDTTKSMF